MNPLERVEAAAAGTSCASAAAAQPRWAARRCFAHPAVPATELNRAIPLSPDVDLDAIAAWFDGSSTSSPSCRSRPALADALAARGYDPAHWMKFERGAEQRPCGRPSSPCARPRRRGVRARRREGYELPAARARCSPRWSGARAGGVSSRGRATSRQARARSSSRRGGVVRHRRDASGFPAPRRAGRRARRPDRRGARRRRHRDRDRDRGAGSPTGRARRTGNILRAGSARRTCVPTGGRR